MATLILDIETVGEEWSALDDTTQVALMRQIDRTPCSEDERSARVQNMVRDLGFSPFTGSIVALGIYDRERAQGVVYYEGGEGPDLREGTLTFKSVTEAQMLTSFWDGVRHYDTVVTFNGRRFDVPFLLHRSVVCRCSPTVDLLKRRFLSQQTPPYHIDLQDELSFYGALLRRPSLQMVCRAYGIEYDDREMVTEGIAILVQAGKFEAVVTQNARDLMATAAVYEKWLRFLAPRELVQNIDF